MESPPEPCCDVRDFQLISVAQGNRTAARTAYWVDQRGELFHHPFFAWGLFPDALPYNLEIGGEQPCAFQSARTSPSSSPSQ